MANLSPKLLPRTSLCLVQLVYGVFQHFPIFLDHTVPKFASNYLQNAVLDHSKMV